MDLFVLKKIQNRKYDSEDLLRKILLLSGVAEVSVKREENGRLSVRAKDETVPLHVSVSHTARYWVCLMDPAGPVGIDIEEKGRKIRPNVLRALHPLERNYLAGMEEGSADWSEAFLDLWTRKESYVKYLGSGLSHGFSDFSVISETGDPASGISDESGALAYLHSPAVSDAFRTALCAAHPPDNIDIRHFKDPGRPLKSAEEHAADFLSCRDYTGGELLEKLLRKGHDPQNAKDAVFRMSESGYLNDAKFSENYVQKAVQQGKGKYRIAQELIRKGVNAEVAQAAVEAASQGTDEREFDRAIRQAKLILSRSGETSDAPLPEKLRGRIARRLAALGYESAVIYEVLERLHS